MLGITSMKQKTFRTERWVGLAAASMFVLQACGGGGGGGKHKPAAAASASAAPGGKPATGDLLGRDRQHQ